MHSPLPVLGRGEPERYESPAQVAGDLNVSLLGALARADSEWTPPLVLSDLVDPEAPFDAVADRIELLAGQMPLKLLGCIGLGDDPLRYRLAANLAARLARTGAQVTLVEAELHAPLLQPDRVRREGLVDMLLYGCSFTAVARESGIPGVKVVSAGSHLWSGEPIHGDEWERVLATLRGNSDYALITTTTGLPAPILGMLARRLDSIVIAYALARASREAVRRSYLALWDMDAPILGLVTEGPHAAGSPRPAQAPERAPATAPPRKPAEATGPPAIGAEWASRLLGEPLAPGASPMTEEVEVVIRQTSEVDAASAALWEKEVERLRSILTAPDGVQPFLDAEAEPPFGRADLDLHLSSAPSAPADAALPPAAADWSEAPPAAAPIFPIGGPPPLETPPDDPFAPPAEPSAWVSAPADEAPAGAAPADALPEEALAEEALPEEAPAEEALAEERLQPALPEEEAPTSGLDWGAAIGAEIASWGAATPPAVPKEPEPTPQAGSIRGLERITIVAEDTFFAGAHRTDLGGTPPADLSPAGAEPPPLPEPTASEPESTPWDSESTSPPLTIRDPATEREMLHSPRTREAAEAAASGFEQLAGGPSAKIPPAAPAPEVEGLESFAIQPSIAPAPAVPPSTPEPPQPMDAPLETLPLEPAAAEATFPWHQAEPAAGKEGDDEAEVELWSGDERSTEPQPPRAAGRGTISDAKLPARDGARGALDLKIIEEIEEELVGATAGPPSAVAEDEPAPSRTPWRVLVIGGLVGLAAVGLWAYQSGMIRLEPPPPRSPSAIEETTPGTPAARPTDQAGAEVAQSGSEPGAVSGGPESAAESGAGRSSDVATTETEKAEAAPPATGGATSQVKLSQDRISTSDMGVGGSAPPVLESKAGSAPTKSAPAKTGSSAPTSDPGATTAAKASAPGPSTPLRAPAPKPSTPAAAPAPASPASPAGSSGEPPVLDAGAVRVIGEMPVGFGVHVSSFRTESTAVNDLARFRTLGYPGVVVTVEVSGRGTWRRVVLGPYGSATEAEDVAAAVRASGLSDKAQTMRLKP